MKKVIIILAVITAGMALLFAQTPTEPAPEEAVLAPAPIGVEKKVEEPLPIEKTVEEEGLGADEITMTIEIGEDALIEEGRISLRLKDAELKDVIRMFSALSGANIIVPDMGEEEIAKKIDVNLDNVEWQPALEAILDTHELELYEKIPASQVYSIRKKTPGAPEALDVKVFKLNYASVNSVTNIVAGLVGETGSYSVFPERNVVVAQGTAKALQRVGLIMRKIDLPRQQVFIEAKFLELTDKAQRDLGVNWQVLQAYGIEASNLGLDYKRDDESTDTDSQFFDMRGRQYEEALGDDQDDLAARPGNPAGDHRIYNMTPTLSNIDEIITRKALTAVLGADDFRLILSALEQKDGVDLVSNPKIIVANEEEAIIHLGQKEPNIRIERTSGTTDNPGGSISVGLDKDMPYFEDGVKVVVKPTINTISNITVKITPELTSFVGRKSVQASGTSVEYPISLTKKVDTVFSLESGQTAAIGGLTQTKESNKENKIPWLGSIPFVGHLFSYQQTIFDQNETIIFVTVGLANPSSIDMETGLPTRTRLAQRYTIREAGELRIAREKENLLRTKESIELQKELRDLREANRKLTEKQATKDAKAAEKEAKAIAKTEAAAAKDAAKEAAATEEALAKEEEVPAETPVEVLDVEPVVEDVESVEEVIEPIDVSAELPVVEKTPSIEEIIESLEPAIEESGGGTATTNSIKSE